MEAHAPATSLSNTSVQLGTSTHGGTSGGQSSSCATVDTFQGHGGEDEGEEKEERGYEELGPSQL